MQDNIAQLKALFSGPPTAIPLPQLIPTSWGFQPFIEGMAITVFTLDRAVAVAEVMVTWEQLKQLKSRATNPAPFKIENTPMSPFSPKEAN
jgi:hypothetical protein